MTMELLSKGHDGQVNVLKSLQQGFGRGTTGAPFGVARIQAWQGFVPSARRWRARNSSKVKTRKPSDNKRISPVARRSLCTYIGESESGLPLKPPKVVLHQIFFAIGQHSLLKRERLLWVIGRIDSPAKAAYRCGYGRLIDLGVQAEGTFDRAAWQGGCHRLAPDARSPVHRYAVAAARRPGAV